MLLIVTRQLNPVVVITSWAYGRCRCHLSNIICVLSTLVVTITGTLLCCRRRLLLSSLSSSHCSTLLSLVTVVFFVVVGRHLFLPFVVVLVAGSTFFMPLCLSSSSLVALNIIVSGHCCVLCHCHHLSCPPLSPPFSCSSLSVLCLSLSHSTLSSSLSSLVTGSGVPRPIPIHCRCISRLSSSPSLLRIHVSVCGSIESVRGTPDRPTRSGTGNRQSGLWPPIDRSTISTWHQVCDQARDLCRSL
jgi:hypothetical protein